MPLEAEPVEAEAAGGAGPPEDPAAPPPIDPGRGAGAAGPAAAATSEEPGGAPPAAPASTPRRDAPPEGRSAASDLPVDGPPARPRAESEPGHRAVPDAGLPDAGEGEQALDPASVTAARLSGAIGVAVGSFSTLAAVLVAAVATPLGWLAAAGLGVAVLGLSAAGAAACYVWPAVRYRHIRYRLDAHGVTIRRGVVWRTVTSVPTSRVQHTDVSRGPVERYFDLATLVIHTAGTRDASVALGGLGHRAALALRDRLIEAGGGRGG